MEHLRHSFRRARSVMVGRRYSTSLSRQSSNRITRISKNLTLHTADASTRPRNSPQTLVLMFPWFRATRSAIQKYCDLYHQRGLDVLCVSCNMRHFLWPSTAKKVARELLNYLSTNETPLSTDKFLIHSASVGSYVYTVTLMEMCENESRYGFVKMKIQGQVFDSIVYGGTRKMLEGVGTVSNNRLVKATAKNVGSMYLTLTRPFTVAFYDRALDFIENSPIHTEVLLYHSLNDPLCDSEAFHDLVKHWSDKEGMELHVKCWDQSTHAMHLRDHRDQYIKAMEAYLENLGYYDTQTDKRTATL